MKKTLSNIDVKKVNRNKIFRYINSKEGVSKPEVAKALGLSTPTVLQNVKELLAEGYLEEVGVMKSTGGRKAVAVVTKKDNFLSIGLDITRNHISIVITDLGSNILHHHRIFKQYEDADSYYKELGAFVAVTMEAFISDEKEVIGVGISIPGIIDEERELIAYSHTLSLHNISYKKFSKYIPFDCEFINDANAACLAETYKSHDNKSAVYLSLSNSVGGAIVLENSSWQDSTMSTDRIFFGDNKRAGEFGHLTLQPEGGTCYCGKTGCVDIYCSALVLSQEYEGKLELFFKDLELGDDKRKEQWHDYLHNLSIVVNNLRMIFDSGVVLGGYVGSFMENYLEDLKDIAKKRNTFEEDATYIQACKFKIEASATGSAIKQIEKFMNRI